jgi:mRNA-degrading endonuclease RelE of RelBE toxin-antitoxin system
MFIVQRSSFIVKHMWNDRLRIVESVEHGWKALTRDERQQVLTALEAIDEDPITGAPLMDPLRGYWSYRTGELRIVYRIMPEARFVVVLSIARA